MSNPLKRFKLVKIEHISRLPFSFVQLAELEELGWLIKWTNAKCFIVNNVFDCYVVNYIPQEVHHRFPWVYQKNYSF